MSLYAETTISISFPVNEDDIEDVAFMLADVLRDYSHMLQDEAVQPRGQVVSLLNARLVASQQVRNIRV